MDIQQILALVCVGVAAVYLGRKATQAVHAFQRRSSGCGGGCGRCGLAALTERTEKHHKAELIPLKSSSQKRP